MAAQHAQHDESFGADALLSTGGLQCSRQHQVKLRPAFGVECRAAFFLRNYQRMIAEVDLDSADSQPPRQPFTGCSEEVGPTVECRAFDEHPAAGGVQDEDPGGRVIRHTQNLTNGQAEPEFRSHLVRRHGTPGVTAPLTREDVEVGGSLDDLGGVATALEERLLALELDHDGVR